MEENVNRREFIRKMVALGFTAAAAAAMYPLLSCSQEKTPVAQPQSPSTPLASPPSSAATPQPITGGHIAVARGQSPKAMVQAAVKSLGGIEKFVKSGSDVIIKPNICVAYHSYEYAATTNPEVVGTLVSLCKDAGAKRIRVMDFPFGGTASQAYNRSGIADAVTKAGGQMEIMSSGKFKDTPIPKGWDIKSWPVYEDALTTDVLINVPIAKSHGSTGLTLGMKNLMGLIQRANQFHLNLGQRIADLNSLIHPAFTLIDAVRILLRNGPTGGNLDDVKLTNTVIASTDIVAADAYAATLFGLTGADISYIKAGSQMGLGTMDLKSSKIDEINI